MLNNFSTKPIQKSWEEVNAKAAEVNNMAQKLGELFTQIAAMAGITATDPRLKDIQSIMTEVPDDLLTEINGKIVSIEGAKNNATLKSYFTATALNPIDEILEEKLVDLGFTDDEITKIKLEKSTPKRLRSIIEEVKKKKAAAPDKSPEKAVLQAEIEKLNAAIAAKDLSVKAAIEEAQKKANESIFEYADNSLLSIMPYANKDLDLDVNVMTAKGVIQKALADKKAKVIRMPDNSFKMVQSEHPDLDFFENNKPVNYTDFVKSTLAAKKMLITSDPTPPGTPGNRTPIHTPAPPGGTDNTALKQAIENAKAEYSKGSLVVQGN